MGGATVMTSDFIFWGGNSSWAPLDAQFKILSPFDYAVSGIEKPLNFSLSGKISKPSDRQLTWVLNLDAAATMSGVIGGGISFKFDRANFESQFGDPALLPDNRGLTLSEEQL